MSAAVEVAEAPEKEWKPDRQVTLERLRIVDMIHEGQPKCRLCGQVVNRLDAAGLCSKTSGEHNAWRGEAAPKTKTRKR